MIIDNMLDNNIYILVIFCTFVTTAWPYRHCSSYSYTSSWFSNRCNGKRACRNLLVIVFCYQVWKRLKIVPDLEGWKLIRCCCCECCYVTHGTAQGCGTPGTLCTSSYRTYWMWQCSAVQTISQKISKKIAWKSNASYIKKHKSCWKWKVLDIPASVTQLRRGKLFLGWWGT